MDNHIFRSAAWGFNRQDVMEYIERTQKEAENTAVSLDEAMEELASLRRQLEEGAEREASLARELEESRRQCEEEKTLREGLQEMSERQEDEICALAAEKDRLAGRVGELAERSENVRREKESLTQLELDARHRAEELMERTQEEADALLARARSEAEDTRAAAEREASETVAQAEAEREALLADAQVRVEETAAQCGELFASSEKAAADIASELHRLSTINGRLPGLLNGLKDDLAQLQEKARER